MKDEELRKALESVLEYFRGKDVNVNTVLAAHLRSRGLAVSGQPWEAAKRAMEREDNFEKAVLAASAERQQGGMPAPVPASQEIILHKLKDPATANNPLVFPSTSFLSKLKHYRELTPTELQTWNSIFQPVYQG